MGASSKYQHAIQKSDDVGVLVKYLEEFSTQQPSVLTAILVTLAGIFDTPTIVMPLPQLGWIIKSLMKIISAVLEAGSDKDLHIPQVHAAQSRESRERARNGHEELLASNYSPQRASRQQQMRQCMVAYSYGVLYNLMKKEECRAALLLHQTFMPSLLATLGSPQFYHSHFSCLHILAVLTHKQQLPKHYASLFFCYLQGYLAYFPSVRTQEELSSHLGMVLTPRDMADFYIPFLFSSSLDCVRLGAFSLQMYYHLRME